MLSLFGKKKSKESKAPSMQQSVGEMRGAAELLDKRNAHIEKQMAACLAKAKLKSKNKDKKGALFELKRKKLFEKQIEQNDNKKMALETQIMALESAASNQVIFQAMQSGKNAMNAELKRNNVEDVEEAIEDIHETMEQANEVNEALANANFGPEVDEEDLDDELADLEAELDEEAELDMERQLGHDVVMPSNQLPQVQLPQVPTGAVKAGKSKEEKELDDLEAMMGM